MITTTTSFLSRHLFTGLMAAAIGTQHAHAASEGPPTLPAVAVASTANSTAPESPVALSENWARPVVPSDSLIRRAVRESVIVEREEQEMAARKKSETAAVRHRLTISSSPDARLDQYQRFEKGFIDAKVPGCFRPDGLKRQSTLIFTGFEALLFIPIAALRGKCN